MPGVESALSHTALTSRPLGPVKTSPKFFWHRERGDTVLSLPLAGRLPLGTRHKPTGSSGLLGHGLVTSEDSCASQDGAVDRVPRTLGAPETQLGPARELAGVQPREGVFPPALPGGSGKSRAQSHSIAHGR